MHTQDGVTEMSEEQQLKAAIEASLQDTMPKPSSKHQRIDSDEFISLSSGDEEEEGGVLVSEMEQDDSIEEEAIDRPTQSELGSHCSDTDLCSRYATNSTVCRTSSGTACLTTASENHHRPLNSRKRKSSGDNECTDDFSAPQRKVPRSSKTNAHEDAQAMGSELHVPVVSELVQNQLKPEKGAVSSRRKGKQRAASSSVVVVSVEERLELGELQKADVSQVVIRLPDGVRIQKAFLRNSPIAVSDWECTLYLHVLVHAHVHVVSNLHVASVPCLCARKAELKHHVTYIDVGSGLLTRQWEPPICCQPRLHLTAYLRFPLPPI